MGRCQWDVLVKFLNANVTVETCLTIEFFYFKLCSMCQNATTHYLPLNVFASFSKLAKMLKLSHWSHISPTTYQHQEAAAYRG